MAPKQPRRFLDYETPMDGATGEKFVLELKKAFMNYVTIRSPD